MKLIAGCIRKVSLWLVAAGAFSGAARADTVAEKWMTLPNNPSNAKYVERHFSTPWPKDIDLGENGFLIAAKGALTLHQVFEMTAKGNCTFIFCDSSQNNIHPIWRKISFKVSKLEVDKLISDIERANVDNLSASYAISYFDGEQAFFSLSDGKHLRSVWMDNYFPEEFRSIIKCIARLIDAQHLDMNLATICEPQIGRSYYWRAFPERFNSKPE